MVQWHQEAHPIPRVPLRDSKEDEKTLRRMVMDYYLDEDVLYKRSFDETLLKCLNEKKVMQALQEINEGIYATHANCHAMVRQM
jgi:hypothetical protein